MKIAPYVLFDLDTLKAGGQLTVAKHKGKSLGDSGIEIDAGTLDHAIAGTIPITKTSIHTSILNGYFVFFDRMHQTDLKLDPLGQ